MKFQKDFRPVWERNKLGGKLIMRLMKGDMIEINDTDGQRRIKAVHRLKAENQQLFLAEHTEGGPLQERHDKKKRRVQRRFVSLGHALNLDPKAAKRAKSCCR